MSKTLEEILKEFSPEARERIEAHAAKLIAEERARQERRARHARSKAASGPVRSNTLTQVPAHG